MWSEELEVLGYLYPEAVITDHIVELALKPHDGSESCFVSLLLCLNLASAVPAVSCKDVKGVDDKGSRKLNQLMKKVVNDVDPLEVQGNNHPSSLHAKDYINTTAIEGYIRISVLSSMSTCIANCIYSICSPLFILIFLPKMLPPFSSPLTNNNNSSSTIT